MHTLRKLRNFEYEPQFFVFRSISHTSCTSNINFNCCMSKTKRELLENYTAIKISATGEFFRYEPRNTVRGEEHSILAIF